MANSQTTTPAPEDRKTPRELVIDMEDEINNLKGYIALLDLAANGAAHGPLTDEAGEGLLRLTYDMTDSLERHHDAYRRLFASVVADRGKGEPAAKLAKPSPVASKDESETSPWQKLYGEWLHVKGAYIERDVSNEEGDRLGDREAEIVLQMAATKAPYRHAIIEKLDILQECMDQGHGWSDNRDRLLLASIRRDVQEGRS